MSVILTPEIEEAIAKATAFVEASHEDLEREHAALRKECADLHRSYADLLLQHERCPTCGGDGHFVCMKCDGTGVLKEPAAYAFTCPECGGHRFGKSSEGGECVTIQCHDQNNQRCKWTGPYAEHVHRRLGGD